MFENILGKKAASQSAVVSIEPLAESIYFCGLIRDNSALRIHAANYCPRHFDREFYDRLTKVIQQQREKNPDMNLDRISLILPDQLFLMDQLSIPAIHRKAMQQSLNIAIESIYKNAKDLSLVTYSIQQAKQTATFGLTGIRRELLEQVRQVFADAGITVDRVTFASNAMVDGAFALNSRIRGESFLLLDIKENYSRFAFVIRGSTMGYFDLPFGHCMLYESRLASEDVLFDHRPGALLVLNAKERARAKQLTMEGLAPESQDGDGPVFEGEAEDNLRRITRRLPKFMQRPVPQNRNEFVYENFRIFIKWALDLIGGNPDIVNLSKIDKVFVNMPEAYRFLFDMVNADKDEHGVTFAPLLPKGMESTFAENLELYGGFFLGQYNEVNTF